MASALAAAGFVFGGASEDDAVADAGGDVGTIGMVVDGVDGGVELFAGASLSANEVLPGDVLAGEVLVG